MSEKMPSTEKRKERVQVMYGLTGHELEYVFTMPYKTEDRMPFDVMDRIFEAFEKTDYEVLDRGTRLEIRNRKDLHVRDDETVISTLKRALGESYDLIARG
jgi:hypothetical protein